ncbi:MAG: hypothetical protein H6865_02995 [Rhodospirillales bacterium]|nr:hypothetical protein [Alphaproteobacteria bacterium]MCB9986584.1 hypothetical protein [Rhodospirillales bacterium]USO06886.1 MAG: hypothetical protein H6866_05390 [Rhodospirillales bacterium]
MIRGQAGLFGHPGITGRNRQRGFSLLLALLFMAVFGAVLVVIARYNSGEPRQNLAKVTGWQLVEIGKAARLYTRDQFVADPTLPNTLAAAAQLVSLQTLKNKGYLPQNFARTTGGLDYNALGQRIIIVMVNWSPSGLGGPPNDPSTVPASFVFFAPGGKSNPELMLRTIQTAKTYGAAVTGLLFDDAGNNLSSQCKGAEAASFWDSGCLTQTEFAAMMNGILPPGSNQVTGGSLVIPSWKAVQPDLRAVMRYPQPENPGFATMLTDLRMGAPTDPTAKCTATADQVQITTVDAAGNPVSVNTGVCAVTSDNATTDRRFDIDKIANVQADRLVAEPQTQDYNAAAETANIGTANDDALYISQGLTLGNDLRVYNTKPLPSGGAHPASARLEMASTAVVERNAYTYAKDVTHAGVATIDQNAQAKTLLSDSLTTNQFTSTVAGISGAAPQMEVATHTTLSGNLTVMGQPDAELLSDTVDAPSALTTATDNTGKVQITGITQMNGSTMTINGTTTPDSGYTTLAGEIANAGNVYVQGDTAGSSTQDLKFLAGSRSLSVTGTKNYAGGALPVVSTTGFCKEGVNVAGGCPDRQYTPPTITP